MSAIEHEDYSFSRYGGYNPAFFKRVQEKRRREEAAAQARADAEKAREDKRRREELARLGLEAVQHFRCITVIENGKAVSLDDVDREPLVFAPKTPVKEIIAHVAAIYGYPVSDILGPRRRKPIVKARHAAMKAVADARPDLSYPQIGKFFGGRDHTTILHAIQKLGGRAKQGAPHV